MQKVIHGYSQVTIFFDCFFAFARGAAFNVKLFEQNNSGVEIVIVKSTLTYKYLLM